VLANDDADVTSWTKTNKIILATQIGYNAKDTAASAFKLQWRNVTDAGAFADVAATGEVKYSATSAVLADGTAVTTTSRRGTAVADQTWQDGLENLADNLLPDSGTLDLGSDYYTELQWGLDLSSALDGKQYEFRLWNNTSGLTVGTCAAQITTISVIEGSVAATLAQTTGAVDGGVVVSGSVAGTAAVATASIAAAAQVSGEIAGALAQVTASIEGTVTDAGITGEVAATVAPVTASVAGAVEVAGVVDGTLSQVTGALAGAVTVSGEVSAELAPVTAAVTGTVESGATYDLIIGGISFRGTESPSGYYLTINSAYFGEV